MLFKVVSKYHKNEIYDVYAIDGNNDCFLRFLIYKNNSWHWVYASNYKPAKEISYHKEYNEIL